MNNQHILFYVFEGKKFFFKLQSFVLKFGLFLLRLLLLKLVFLFLLCSLLLQEDFNFFSPFTGLFFLFFLFLLVMLVANGRFVLFLVLCELPLFELKFDFLTSLATLSFLFELFPFKLALLFLSFFDDLGGKSGQGGFPRRRGLLAAHDALALLQESDGGENQGRAEFLLEQLADERVGQSEGAADLRLEAGRKLAGRLLGQRDQFGVVSFPVAEVGAHEELRVLLQDAEERRLALEYLEQQLLVLLADEQVVQVVGRVGEDVVGVDSQHLNSEADLLELLEVVVVELLDAEDAVYLGPDEGLLLVADVLEDLRALEQPHDLHEEDPVLRDR